MKLSRNIIMIACVLCMVALTACKIDQSDPNKTPQTPSASTDTKTLYLVTSENEEFNTEKVLNKLTETAALQVRLSDGTENKGKLFIGESDSAVSKKAYGALENLLDNWEEMSGYVICSLDENLAIAFDSEFALNDAIDALLDLLSNDLSNELKNGILAKSSFYYLERLDHERNAMRNEEFSKLSDILGDEAIQSLRDLYALYGRDMYTWIANLWCPDTGGFYYSQSGRDTIGFLPDLESTRQAFSCLTQAGMFTYYGDDYSKAISQSMKESIIDFVKGLQSPIDGYFYHPQWGESISNTRRGRDLDWAETILEALGAQPLYDTPNKVKGSLGAPSGNTSAAAVFLTGRLSENIAMAVSKIIPIDSTLPAHLKDLGAFENYLDGLEISKKSYAAGNSLAATATQIVSAGKEYVDFLENYLNNLQKKNGLWEDSVTYGSVNGLMKISQTYTIIDRPFPNPESAMKSAIAIALTPSLTEFTRENDNHICSVYNPWVAMAHVISGAGKAFGNTKVAELRQLVLDRANDLVSMTANKLKLFKKSDGGFSYTPFTSAEFSSSVPVALPNCAESDMNATSIASGGTMSAMFTVLGVGMIDMYIDADCQYFLEMIAGFGTIIKFPRPETERYTFEYHLPENNPTYLGVLLSPEEGVSTVVGDTEISSNRTYKWFASDIIENTAKGAPNGDLVLKSSTYVYPGEEKDKANADSKTSVVMKTTNVGGNCYVFESSVLINGANGLIGQLFFTKEDELHTLGFTITAYTEDGDQYLKFGEVYTGLDTVKDNAVAVKVPCGEWFNLRIELYKDFDDDLKLTVNAKLFINGVMLGECDGGYFSSVSKEFINRLVDRVNIYYYRGNQSDIYLNDILCERIKKEFVSEDPDRPQPPPPEAKPELPPEPSIPVPPTEIAVEDYEKYSEGESLGYKVSSGSSTGYEAQIGLLNDNKFLLINNRANTGSKYIKHAVVTSAKKQGSFSYFEFGTQLKIDALKGTHTIQNLRLDGTGTSYAFLIDIMVDGSIKLYSVNTDTKENYYYTTDPGVIKANTEHSMKLVGNTEIGGYMALYVDGEYTAGVKVAKTVDGIGFVLQSNATGALSFDNSYFIMYNETADSDEPVQPDAPVNPEQPDIPDEPYEPKIPDTTESTLPLPEEPIYENFDNKTVGEIIGTVVGTGATEGYTSTIVDNNGDKALKISYTEGGGKTYVKQAIVTNPSDGGSYTYFLFETDLTIDELSGIVTLQHLTASNTTNYALFIDIGTDGSVTLSSYNTQNSPATKNVYTTAAGVIKAGTKHNIRVVGELAMGGVMALYIDGIYYGKIEVARTILSVGFIYQTNAKCSVMLDNCCFYLYNDESAEPDLPDDPEVPELVIPEQREVEDFEALETTTAFQSLVMGYKSGGSLSMMVQSLDGDKTMIFRNKNGTDSAWYTLGQNTSTEGEKYLFETKIMLHSKFDGMKIYNYKGDDVTVGTNEAMVIEIADGGAVTLRSGEESATSVIAFAEDSASWYSVKVVGGTKAGDTISLYINDTVVASVALADSLEGYTSFKISINPATVTSSGNLFWIDDCGVTFFN